ncbi:MAG: HD domain-containing phosphohydrolase [Actinomycetes bacterium]
MDEQRDDGMRWTARPALARGLRWTVFLSPVAASVGVSWLVHLALGPASGRPEHAWHLAVLVVASTLTLVAIDRVLRRALPLVTLLELSMLFPDRAPSRLEVARDAIRTRPIELQLARVREAGADPAAVAREILALVAALRVHDRPTRGHAERVRMFTDLVAEAMGMAQHDRDLLRWAAILHDIGKLRVPPAILNKPGKPTDDEWVVLRAHPGHGAEMAAALLPWLGSWGDVIVQHHERYDGTGYPSGLAGREISLGGRIVAVADAYDVMTAARAYRRPVSRAAANAELVRWSGRQFDPTVVRAMVGLSAPRLRRAQGLVAWLSDIPIVASGSVPAATVARVVGAGALATGAATGLAVPTAAETPPPTGVAVVAATSAAVRLADTGPAHSTAPVSRHRGSVPLTTTTAPARKGRARPAGGPLAGAVGGSNSARPAPAHAAGPAAGPTAGPRATGSGGPTAAATPATPSGGTSSPTRDPGTVLAPVVTAASGAVGAVTGTVDATVGGVTGAVASAVPVASPVASAVNGVTGAVTGTVTRTVGGLLGGKK